MVYIVDVMSHPCSLHYSLLCEFMLSSVWHTFKRRLLLKYENKNCSNVRKNFNIGLRTWYGLNNGWISLINGTWSLLVTQLTLWFHTDQLSIAEIVNMHRIMLNVQCWPTQMNLGSMFYYIILAECPCFPREKNTSRLWDR